MKYIKKPIPVEAIQWNGNNYGEIREFYGKDLENIGQSTLVIDALEGRMMCPVGSYMVQGTIGEFWAVREDIFEATYDRLGTNSYNNLM